MPIPPPETTPPPGSRPATPDAQLRRRIQAAAVEAVRAAGRLQMKGFGRPQAVDDRRAHDLKLAVDRRSEAAVLAVLRERFPDHGIVAEESGVANPDAPFRWYLDPLDGSLNYFMGLPYFCVCLVCCHTLPADGDAATDPLGRPVAGIVYAPALGKCFEAAPGGPAYCNGRPIRPGSETLLAEAVVGFSYGSDPLTMQRMAAVGAELVHRVRKVRIYGATGLDMVHVASGGLSGLVQGRVKIWDFAAAKVIVEAAGAYFRAEEAGGGSWRITAAAPGIARALQDVMDRHWSRPQAS